jgi:hypothetical protein
MEQQIAAHLTAIKAAQSGSVVAILIIKDLLRRFIFVLLAD